MIMTFIVAVSILLRPIETATELRPKGRGGGAVCGKAKGCKKRKLEKRQVKSLKLLMGELCLAAL